ncbi:DMT family transporter [Roseovarius nubinhibens]
MSGAGARGTGLGGLWLALAGALILTPDAMLMRLSGLETGAMLGWRGLCMGSVLVLFWGLSTGDRRGDLAALRSAPGLGIAACQFFNSLFFCLGIALAPVAAVLLGVAVVPVWAALLGWMLLGERAGLRTWATIAAVLLGIAIAMSGHGGDGISWDARAGLGIGLGLLVALMLALNFVILRKHHHVPIPLAIGAGALVAGVGATTFYGGAMWAGTVWPMLMTGAVVLPASFMLLSQASRQVSAAVVSLLLLLETVLGPLWVWLAVGEAPGARMLWGGALVVGALALFLLHRARRARR